MLGNNKKRTTSFAQNWNLTWIDRFGIYLSVSRIEKTVGSLIGRSVADIGCGFNAHYARSIMDKADSVFLADVAIHPEIQALPGVTTALGYLPESIHHIEDNRFDVVICNNVLEHVFDVAGLVGTLYRVCRSGGYVLINVPSWRGKFFLEYFAFRLGLSDPNEMNDHKMYYDPRDLWPILVKAGFIPQHIKCFKHKFGLNTFAVCQKMS